MSPLEPVITDDEVRDLERRRLRSLVEQDVMVARTLHAPDYELITPGAARLSREDYLGGIAAGELDYEVFEADSDVAVLRLGDGGFALRYVARIVIAFPGGHEEGRYWHTDLWAAREAGWQAVWSQATRIRPTSDG